jgi:hypothetical protein
MSTKPTIAVVLALALVSPLAPLACGGGNGAGSGGDGGGADGSTPDAATPDGSSPDGTSSDGATSDGPVSDGTPSDGASLDGADGGDGASPLAKACDSAAKAACARVSSCSSRFLIDFLYGDSATCEARSSASCYAATSANGSQWTADGVDTCAGQYSAYPCQKFFEGSAPPACIVDGSLAEGAPCAVADQCASGYCSADHVTACGTCQSAPPLGHTCRVDADCGRGRACVKASGAATGVCADWVALSQPCDTKRPCAPGLSCVGANDPTPGTCMNAGSSTFTACDATAATKPGCDPLLGLVCVSGMCKKVTENAAGQTCGLVSASFYSCKAGAACIKSSPMNATGICTAAAEDGKACDEVNGPPCLAPAKCIPTGTGSAGVCTLPDPSACH